jgi:hypothetical protein
MYVIIRFYENLVFSFFLVDGAKIGLLYFISFHKIWPLAKFPLLVPIQGALCPVFTRVCIAILWKIGHDRNKKSSELSAALSFLYI